MKVKLFQDSGKNPKPDRQPFFSIIITTYNRANVLTKALDSLLFQTEYDWEAIIVDDESADNTHLKILPYLTSHREIRYLRKAHSGEALSKNANLYLSP